MKLVTFQSPGGIRLGLKMEQGIVDVQTAAVKLAVEAPASVEAALAGGQAAADQLNVIAQEAAAKLAADSTVFHDESTITYGPCVPNPGKIICVGTNYKRHAEESGMPVPDAPLLFSKFGNTIAAPGEEVPLPFNSKQNDYEAELGIVIGKTAKRVTKESALDYVFGYCNVNDLSSRDLQFRTHQWLLGKSCDKFSPVGPYLVSADEVGDPNNLRVRCLVNGEVRQDSNTSDMIFDCSEIVSYISEHMTLKPGDLILTGTPEGVVFNGFDGKESKKKPNLDWLKPGDVVTIEIEKLGSLTNRMIAEE